MQHKAIYILLLIGFAILIGINVSADAMEVELSQSVKADKPHAFPVEVTEPVTVHPITSEERDTIAAVCFYEDRGGGMGGMMAVASVILNRLNDGRFGATVSEVCTPSQFHGMRQIGTLEVSEEAYEAVYRVFDKGEDAGIGQALYFCTGNSNGIKRGLVKVSRAGGHTFYAD